MNFLSQSSVKFDGNRSNWIEWNKKWNDWKRKRMRIFYYDDEQYAHVDNMRVLLQFHKYVYFYINPSGYDVQCINENIRYGAFSMHALSSPLLLYFLFFFFFCSSNFEHASCKITCIRYIFRWNIHGWKMVTLQF